MGTSGIVLIDKPAHITSRKVVDRVMAILNEKRAGHFGSLDPFATGLLCVGIGQGTKLLPFLQHHIKGYIALMGFDMTTDTDDLTGEVLKRFDGVRVDRARIEEWFDANRGLISQVPPDYCAQKHGGKPLYKLKRAKQEVSPRPKQVSIDEASILDVGPDWVRVRIVCSRGTYIRSIARDLGAALGVGGYLRELRRTHSEGFSIEKAVTLEALAEAKGQALISLEDAISLPKARVTQAGEAGIADGKAIQLSWVMDDVVAPEGAFVAVLNGAGTILCIARIRRDGGIWGYIERGFSAY